MLTLSLAITLWNTSVWEPPSLSTSVSINDEVGTPLWREPRVGMTPEQTADALRAVQGVSEVAVRRSRRNHFRSIAIRYASEGVIIGNMRSTLEPTFVDKRLQEISLTSEACAAAGAERLSLIGDALRERYGGGATERVVDEDGVEFQQRLAFWNDTTRVRVSWQIERARLEYVRSSGKSFEGALASIANAAAQSDYDAALNACPSDAGAKLKTRIS